MSDVVERAEATLLEDPVERSPFLMGSLVAELLAALKDARAEVRSHQDTVIHAQDALVSVQGEFNRQLDLNDFAANALETAQIRDPSQNWRSLIERLRGERRWLGEMQ